MVTTILVENKNDHRQNIFPEKTFANTSRNPGHARLIFRGATNKQCKAIPNSTPFITKALSDPPVQQKFIVDAVHKLTPRGRRPRYIKAAHHTKYPPKRPNFGPPTCFFTLEYSSSQRTLYSMRPKASSFSSPSQATVSPQAAGPQMTGDALDTKDGSFSNQ